MRELLKICPKIQVFKIFLVLFETGEGEFDQKRCKRGCSNTLGTNWKNYMIKPWENGDFPHLALFSRWSLSNIWHSHLFINYFSEKHNIELSSHKVLF